jgi:hypothetical protein
MKSVSRNGMKKHLLALPFAIVLTFCISGYSSINSNAAFYIDSFLSDTVKTTGESDSLSMLAESEAISSMDVWREWKTVQNFQFGKDRGNLPMIADLHSLHPFFRDKVSQLIVNCKKKGIELIIVESYRTHAKQSEYYRMGRKYTRSAGGKSKHQYGLAVDVVPVKDSVAIWDNVALWKKIGAEGEKLGLRWGGRWRSPYDPAHFEWTGGLTSYHLSAGALPPIPKAYSEHYPCIEDDIKELRKYWELWESEQLLLLADDHHHHPTTASNQKP